MSKHLRSALGILLGFLLALGAAAQDFRAAFDRLDSNFNQGLGHSLSSNDNGDLAWHEGYLLQAYLQLYRKTGEPRYLQNVVRHAEGILAQRDDRAGRTDYRGRSEATWISTKYTEGEPYAWAVHTGILCFPMADWAATVLQDSSLHGLRSTSTGAFKGQSFKSIADRFILECERSIQAHEDQWVEDPLGWDSKDSIFGSYRHRPDAAFNCAGTLYPLNKNQTMGLALLALYQATGKAAYRDRVVRLANDFHRALRWFPKTNHYEWRFWGNFPHCQSNRMEDISHAGISIDFAVLCAEAGIVFTETDLQRLANTFLVKVYKGPSYLANHVHGQSYPSQRPNQWIDQGARWLKLAPYAPEMVPIMADYYLERGAWSRQLNSGSRLLGVAHLACYAPDLSIKAVQRGRAKWGIDHDLLATDHAIEVCGSYGVKEWTANNHQLRLRWLHSSVPAMGWKSMIPWGTQGRIALSDDGRRLVDFPEGFQGNYPRQELPLPLGFRFEALSRIHVLGATVPELLVFSSDRPEVLVMRLVGQTWCWQWRSTGLNEGLLDWRPLRKGGEGVALTLSGKVVFGKKVSDGFIWTTALPTTEHGRVLAIAGIEKEPQLLVLATQDGSRGVLDTRSWKCQWSFSAPHDHRMKALAGWIGQEGYLGLREYDGDTWWWQWPEREKEDTLMSWQPVSLNRLSETSGPWFTVSEGVEVIRILPEAALLPKGLSKGYIPQFKLVLLPPHTALELVRGPAQKRTRLQRWLKRPQRL